MTTELDLTNINHYRTYLQRVDWFGHFSDSAKAHDFSDEQKAIAKEWSKYSHEHTTSHREYVAYVFRGINEQTDWEQCVRPEWDGPDSDLLMWRFKRNPEVIELLESLPDKVSQIVSAISDWKLHRMTYTWANMPSLQVPENRRTRIAVSDYIWKRMVDIEVVVKKIFLLATSDDLLDLIKGNFRFLYGYELDHQKGLYRLSVVDDRYFVVDQKLYWNMQVPIKPKKAKPV